MPLDRRGFLLRGASLAAGAAALSVPLVALAEREAGARAGRLRGRRGDDLLAPDNGGYGELVQATAANDSTNTDLRLPAGFSFVVFGEQVSSRIETSAGSRPTPASHDGMAAFAGADGTVRLVRNHEVSGARPDPIDPGVDRNYDRAAGGGTTTLVFDPETRELVRQFASLSGTERNCAGGPTPWGSWITCEETFSDRGTVGEVLDGSFPPYDPPDSIEGLFFTQDHGYVFEVPADADSAVVNPQPITAMGRFRHEAIAIDAETGTVYLTEDAGRCALYRFVPDQPPEKVGDLARGGRLEALRIAGRPGYDTRRGQYIGKTYPVEWVTIDEPNPTLENGAQGCYEQALAKGAATFARGEGAWYGGGGRLVFTFTSGGDAERGQVFEYRAREGVLKLMYESPAGGPLESPDNCVVSPRGSVVLCEDGPGVDFVRALSPQGQLFTFAENSSDQAESEIGGACFSPDGRFLFLNIQAVGRTYAITGPFERGLL